MLVGGLLVGERVPRIRAMELVKMLNACNGIWAFFTNSAADSVSNSSFAQWSRFSANAVRGTARLWAATIKLFWSRKARSFV